MLVDVVELNYRGKRLPREVWRSAVPVRGELAILKYMSWHGHEGGPVQATLRPYGLLEGLNKARVLHLWGRNMVIGGEQRALGMVNDQLWWCRMVSASFQQSAPENRQRRNEHSPALPEEIESR